MSETRRGLGSGKPPALTHLFEPPVDHIGGFGWICGYAADAFFLNDAAERFTRRTRRRRATDGDVALGLILDPGNPRLSPVDVPGVLHVPLVMPQSFRLMHSKVALLGFRCLSPRRENSLRWRLRLIVATGNWTRETLEESLDLAWTVEVGSDELDAGNDGSLLADLKAASDFLEGLRAMTGAASPLDVATSVTREAARRFDEWCSTVARKARRGERPRFIHSWNRALLPQITERITPGKRNYLAMGSGFYEGGGSSRLPRVPDRIVRRLREAGLQTQDAEIDLFVNPGACQAVATAMAAVEKAGWTVRRPRNDASRDSRSLHAKFLFGAHYDQRSPRCLRAWVYLGSGNLTHPGFLQAADVGGNLEAGVVFAPDKLVWDEARDRGDIRVQDALPVAWDDKTKISGTEVASGDDMPDRPPAYVAPPIPYLRWKNAREGTGRLLLPAGNDTAAMSGMTVLDPGGAECARDAAGIIWNGSRPLEVTVAWSAAGQRCSERVAVVDEGGRIAAADLTPVPLGEVWGLLADFPLPPGDDEDEPDEAPSRTPDGNADHPLQARPAAKSGSYPIRRVMELVEQIAARQTALQEADWTAWCVRLEQGLTQAKDDAEIAEFRALGLNPLSPLRTTAFRPDFAQDGTTAFGRTYEATLERIAKAWRVDKLEPLDG